MSLPSKLPNLSTREAITDAIYRAVEAYDTGDAAMLSSSMTSDVVFEMDSHVIIGLDNIIAKNFGHVGGNMDTTHFTTNVRISLESDVATTATATANVLAQHYPKGMGNDAENRRLLVGARYFCELAKVEAEGLWKLKKLALNVLWREGDASVMVP